MFMTEMWVRERVPARRPRARARGRRVTGWRRRRRLAPPCFQRFEQEVLEDDAAVARLVDVLPARGAALVPVLEGLFEVELDGVNQLPVGALDHHLVAAEVGGRQ